MDTFLENKVTRANNDKDKSRKIIMRQIQAQGIKTNSQVEDLYMVNEDLTDIIQLACFPNLKYLRLNNNKLRSIKFLYNNLHISELYLHCNNLVDIGGCLSHLTSLNKVTLHNNQLTQLEKVVNEFNNMQALENLNLSGNPVAQEHDYRHYVIFYIPSLKILDRQEIIYEERIHAQRIYDQEQQEIRDSVAFGSKLKESVEITRSTAHIKSGRSHSEFGNNFFRLNPPCEDEEEAVEKRRLKKSVVELSRFDWSKVPRYVDRRQAENPIEHQPELVTVRLKL